MFRVPRRHHKCAKIAAVNAGADLKNIFKDFYFTFLFILRMNNPVENSTI